MQNILRGSLMASASSIEPAPTAPSPPTGPTNPDASGEPPRLLCLDGLRGVAILLVIAFHANLLRNTTGPDLYFHDVAANGWMGVDLFFVLSGFLITGILLDARNSPGYFRNFYGRRLLRIFPLYYLALVLIFFVWRPLFAADNPNMAELYDQQIWYWSYLSNLWVAGMGSYPRFLGICHFWSLAVEEQFYLVWPAVVLLLSRERLRLACIAIVFGALALRLTLLIAGAGAVTIYVSTACRADALAIGALVAIAAREGATGLPVIARLRTLGWVATVFVVFRVFFSDGLRIHDMIDPAVDTTRDYDFLTMGLGFSATPLMSAMLLISVLGASSTSLLRRFLSSPALVTLGKYSYCIYIVHWPLAYGFIALGLEAELLPKVLGTRIPAQLVIYALVVLISLAIAVLSWNLFESHFLKLKRYFAYDHATAPLDAEAFRRPPRNLEPIYALFIRAFRQPLI